MCNAVTMDPDIHEDDECKIVVFSSTDCCNFTFFIYSYFTAVQAARRSEVMDDRCNQASWMDYNSVLALYTIS
ncbi:hypothetical protein, partial [Pseudoalteromonas luteoviolacea]|uniref:hypothetical protein n=1 Tax=Pseudoalteromonas luteoviolacea TaxID=43657 RepID=UPI0019D3F202